MKWKRIPVIHRKRDKVLGAELWLARARKNGLKEKLFDDQRAATKDDRARRVPVL